MGPFRTLHLGLIIIIIIGSPAFSQDLIFKSNGTKVEAKIVKSDSLVISYYKYADTSDTLFNLSTFYVDRVEFEDGSSIVFDKPEPPQIKPLERNIVQANLFSLLAFGNISVRYERITGTGSIGLFAGAALTIKPEIFEYQNNDDYKYISVWGLSMSRSVFYFETGMIYYPVQRSIVRYGAGFSTIVGVYKVDIYENYYPAGLGYATFGKLMLNNQIRLYVSESIQLHVAYDLAIIRNLFQNSVLSIGASHSF